MNYELSTYEDSEDDYIIVNSGLTRDIDTCPRNYIDLNINMNMNIDNIILPFNTIDLINTFKHTYKSYKEIYNQYVIDTKRTKLYHNNNTIDTNYLFNIISNLTGSYLSVDDILSCCTQSIFYWPYKIIQLKYCKPDNYHLGELSYDNKYKYKNEKSIISNRVNKYRNKPSKNNKYNKNCKGKNTYIKYIDNGSNELLIFKKLRVFKIDECGNDMTILIKTIKLSISLYNNISILEIC